MLELKKRLAIIALGIITLWPGLHFGLYQGFGIDPWKLFGWAMYTKPQEVQQLGVFELRDGPAARPGGRLREVPLNAGPIAAEVERLGVLRSSLGALQPMDSLGEMILAEQPDLPGVQIRVRRWGLSCSSGYIEVLGEDVYEYRWLK